MKKWTEDVYLTFKPVRLLVCPVKSSLQIEIENGH